MKIRVIKAAKRFIGKTFDFGEVSKKGKSLNPDKSISFEMYFFNSYITMDNKQYRVIVINRPWCNKWQAKLNPLYEIGARTITLDDVEVLTTL